MSDCEFVPGEPGVAAAPPEAAELRRGPGRTRGAWSASARMGDGQDALWPALLHEPHHQDNPVGRPEKGETFCESSVLN